MHNLMPKSHLLVRKNGLVNQVKFLVSSYLITELDCELDHWTGRMDWITGLTFVLKLCVPHDLHPIRCAELGHMIDANGLPWNKGHGMHKSVGVLCPRDLKGRPILQQMELLGRPIIWHHSLFQALSLTKQLLHSYIPQDYG